MFADGVLGKSSPGGCGLWWVIVKTRRHANDRERIERAKHILIENLICEEKLPWHTQVDTGFRGEGSCEARPQSQACLGPGRISVWALLA